MDIRQKLNFQNQTKSESGSYQNFPFNSNFSNDNTSNSDLQSSFNSLVLFIKSLNMPKSLRPIIDKLNAQAENDLSNLNISKYTIDKWIDNFKRFICGSLIPSLLDEHFMNLNMLSKMLIHYNIGICERINDLNNQSKFQVKVFESELQRRINSKQHFEYFRGEKNHSNADKLEIFFGDMQKIQLLYDLLSSKLFNIGKENKKIPNPSSTYDKNPLDLDETVNDPNCFTTNVFSNSDLFKNKLRKINSNMFSLGYVSTKNDSDNNLQSLINLLDERKKINSKIFPGKFLANHFIKNQQYKNFVLYLLNYFIYLDRIV